MGHEAVGVVDEIGAGVAGLRRGDRVIINPTLYCGSCPACLRGRLNFCTNKSGTEVGIDRDGAFAEYVRLPERFCYPIPAEMSFERAVVVEPLACALNNIEAGELRAGETVVVVGGGPVGVVCAMVAQFFGSAVLLVEPDQFRRLMCQEILDDGTGRCSLHTPEDPALAGRGDLVIDTVGSLLEQSLDYASDCARIVIMGYNDQVTATIRPLEVLQRGLRILGAGDYNSQLFPRAVELARWLPLEKLVTHRFGLTEFEDAFAALAPAAGMPYSALKVVISQEAQR